jgi:transaldolase
MKILIDTLDLKEIKKYSDMGIISGVTTNPTFSKRFGMEDDIDTIKQVSDALGGKGDIYIEAFGHTMREIEDNAHRISNGSSYKNIKMKKCYDTNSVTTKIMGSSIRNVNHVIELYKVGIDAITIPPEILEKMFYHPLTDSGFKTFAKDLKNIE